MSSLAPKLSRPHLRAAYSDRDAHLMSQLSEAAYLLLETDDGREQLAKRLSDMGFSLRETYFAGRSGFMKRRRGTEAYLCENEHMVVLAFRGSMGAQDWLTNFNLFKKTIPVGEYDGNTQMVRVHRGFWLAFEEHLNLIRTDIERVMDTSPVKPIFFTGHSLGGALAQLATLTWSCDQIAACYSFGAPRVGNASLDRFVKPPHYRLSNEWDTVPFIPSYLLGYRHTGDARSILGTPPRLLRRSRPIFQQWFIVLLRLILTPFALLPFFRPRRFFIVRHHSIRTYVSRLAELVERRSKLNNETCD